MFIGIMVYRKADQIITTSDLLNGLSSYAFGMHTKHWIHNYNEIMIFNLPQQGLIQI
jgi:hypothetical protein